MSRVEVKGLFPVPFMRVERLVPLELTTELIEDIRAARTEPNARSERLHHTEMTASNARAPYRAVDQLARPHLIEFGKLLFGEPLDWHVKEMWTNRLERGGAQALHSHSNSFISGVIYLTECHPSARTVFHRDMGSREFVFSNDNPRAQMGPFNGNKWVSPPPAAGDMVLFPSYLLHEVPRNAGDERITLAFNAIPDKLDTWGYTVRFASEPSV